MKITSKYTLGFRRKRKGLTDYRKRLKILTSKKHRLVVRKSLTTVQASIVEYDNKGDKITACANSSQIKKMGWKFSPSNMSAAYLVGYSLGKKAAKAGIKEAVLDFGMQKIIKQGKLYAVLAGVLEAGVQIPHSEEVLPNENRLNGKHVEEYAKSLKDNNEALQKQFGACIKNGANPEQMSAAVAEVKAAIEKQ